VHRPLHTFCWSPRKMAGLTAYLGCHASTQEEQMRDQLTSPGILASPDLFRAIEAEAGTATALSMVVLEPDECAPGIPAATVTVAQAREIVLDRAPSDPLHDAIWAVLVRRAMT